MSLSLYNKMKQFVVTAGVAEVAFPLPVDPVANPEAIFIQSDDGNTGKIYLGKAGVLADGTTGAYVFSPGDNGILPYVRDEDLKHISTIAGQKLFITYLAERSSGG